MEAAVAYALRWDAGSDERDAAVLALLASDGGAHLVVLEGGGEGENPHYHAVFHSVKKVAALRKSLQRALAGSGGNGSYSLTPVRDYAKYCRYICKGLSVDDEPLVIQAHGVQYDDPAYVEDQHVAYWEENAVLREEQAARVKPVFEAVFERVRREGLRWDQDQRIAAVWIEECVARGKSINTFAVRAQLNLLQCRLCPDGEAVRRLAQAIADRGL